MQRPTPALREPVTAQVKPATQTLTKRKIPNQRPTPRTTQSTTRTVRDQRRRNRSKVQRTKQTRRNRERNTGNNRQTHKAPPKERHKRKPTNAPKTKAGGPTTREGVQEQQDSIFQRHKGGYPKIIFDSLYLVRG